MVNPVSKGPACWTENLRVIEENLANLKEALSETKKKLAKLERKLRKSDEKVQISQRSYKQQAELLLSLINASEDLIFAKDTNYKVIACNEAFGKLVGWPINKIIGNSDEDWLSDAAKVASFREWDRKLFRDKKV